MNWKAIKAKLKKYTVKALIFRPGLPTIVDYARRKDNERYHLLEQKKMIPSPPGNKYIHFFDGNFWIFLVSPRIGTYYYTTTPDINFDPETQTMNVKYLTRTKDLNGKLVESEFSSEELGINLKDNTITNKTLANRVEDLKVDRDILLKELKNVNNTKERANKIIKGDKINQKNYDNDINLIERKIAYLNNLIKTNTNLNAKEQIVETNFELIDHDDLNWLAGETQKAESKYTPKDNWWDKHSSAIINGAFIVAVAIAIYILYQQVISPAALLNIHPLSVTCNYPSTAGVI